MSPYRLDSEPELLEKVRRIVEALATRDAEWLQGHLNGIPDNRVSPADFLRELDLYSVTFTKIPEIALQRVEIHPTKNSQNWWLDLELHCIEEGQTDLTLQLDIKLIDGKLEPQIHDLHVL